ncbi:MAG: 2-phosphosulfolactate phosphatase [Bacteroidales bacterium]|nr:2-phosphosulfolactate phosphatase [Bacteroidales bacterium]
MRIEVVLSPTLYDGRNIQLHHTTVAVDVLRATSAICAAFCAGADEIVPLDSLEPLPEYRERGYTLAAERNGEKISGALCGNSPTEYLSMDLRGQRLAYSTTNGTVSILRAASSERLYIGTFANISALSKMLALDKREDLVVLCSGWKGDPSIEDTLFAGALIEKMFQQGCDIHLINDAAIMAESLWREAKNDLYNYCLKATHVKRLQRLNYENDIRWALTLDTCQIVPQYINGKLVICASAD